MQITFTPSTTGWIAATDYFGGLSATAKTQTGACDALQRKIVAFIDSEFCEDKNERLIKGVQDHAICSIDIPCVPSDVCVIERKALTDLIVYLKAQGQAIGTKCFEAVEQQGEIWCACETDVCTCGLG